MDIRNTTTMLESREVRLRNFPTGRMSEDDFEIATVPVFTPREGEVLVRNLWLSIEASMRVMMFESDIDDIKKTVPGFRPGKPVHSFAVGRIVHSRHPGLPVGSYVTGVFDWQELFISNGKGMRKIGRAHV